MNEHYEFTDLNQKEQLLADIRALEEKIEQSVGRQVNLIAYSPSEEKGSAHLSNCRAGLED
jgi:hypothetical protein